MGGLRIELSELLDADGLFLERRRALLDGAVNARITVACQMWPVMRSMTPVEELIERAVADERSRMLREGRGIRTAIWVFCANNLPNVDFLGGKSDPYCVCTLEGLGRPRQIFQTPVINNDSDPEWNHGPEMVEWGGESVLRLQVFDKNVVRRGPLLGEAVLSRDECQRGLFTDLDLGNGTSLLSVKLCPERETGLVDVPYSAPVALPRLHVWIEKAHDLRGVNWRGGKSDPYVVCRLSQRKEFKTPVIHDELNPNWKHGPEEFTLGPELVMKFDVRDKDMVGSSSIGTAELTRYQCLAGFSTWLSLGPGNGRLLVRIEPFTSGGHASRPMKPVKLSISVLSAANLRKADTLGSSDPYVICIARGKERLRTEVIRKDLNPRWNPNPYQVELRLAQELCFEVYDKDLFRKGDLLGRATIDRYRCESGFDGSLDLGPGNGTLKVRISSTD